jgi:hypothetical protein
MPRPFCGPGLPGFGYVFISEGRLSFNMEAERIGPHRAAIVIVRGVADVLGIEWLASNHLYRWRIVITFPRVFGRVVQRAVADEKVEAATAQVERMDGRDARGRKFGTDGVVGRCHLRARPRKTPLWQGGRWR